MRLLPLSAYPFPVYLREFGALLVVAVGLLALAWPAEMAALAALAALVRRHDGAVNGSRPKPAAGEA